MTVSPDDIAGGTLPPDASVWDRRMKALTMRNAGATFPRIAEQLGVSEMTVRNDIHKAVQEVVRMPVDQMVDRQRAILLDITRVNYPAAMGGDREAQGVLLRVLEHEAKLFGLYAPARVTVGISEQEFAAQAAELLTVLGTEPLRELAGSAYTAADETPPLDAEIVAQVADAPVQAPAAPDDDTWSNL